MDDEEEDRPPFRWNWQAGVMVVFTAVMLIVPLAGVMYLLRGYVTAPSPAPAGAAMNARPLASALENAADAQLGGARVKLDPESGMTLTLPTDQIASRLARIAELARNAGGSALDMPASRAGSRRLLIQVPGSRRELLRRAILGEKIDFTAAPADSDSQMLDVTLEAP